MKQFAEYRDIHHIFSLSKINVLSQKYNPSPLSEYSQLIVSLFDFVE